jgi:DNA-binding PucR family transcriptional regulator
VVALASPRAGVLGLVVLVDPDRRAVATDVVAHTELLKTLTQYLQHGGGYDVTSRALSVHGSTLKYGCSASAS